MDYCSCWLFALVNMKQFCELSEDSAGVSLRFIHSSELRSFGSRLRGRGRSRSSRVFRQLHFDVLSDYTTTWGVLFPISIGDIRRVWWEWSYWSSVQYRNSRTAWGTCQARCDYRWANKWQWWQGFKGSVWAVGDGENKALQGLVIWPSVICLSPKSFFCGG